MALALLPAPLAVATFGVSASDAGFFNAAGRSSKNDGVVLGASPATFNYSAGAIDEAVPLTGADVPRKNYFTFDLAGVSDPILGASLELFLPPTGYGSPDPFEIYSVYGSLLPGVAEMSAFGTDLTDVYSILSPPELALAMVNYTKLGDTKGTFPPFALAAITPADAGSMLSLSLTPTGVAYLKLFKGGLVALAGELDTLDGVPGADEFVFGFTAPLIPGVVSPDPVFSPITPTPMLMLETEAAVVVPEPSTSAAALALLLGTGVWLSRRCRR